MDEWSGCCYCNDIFREEEEVSDCSGGGGGGV